MTLAFLTLAEVIEIHRDQITRYGGSHGVRDLGLLQSAVAQPEVAFGGQFLHADIFEMAAAYLFHIVQNHPFLDGNKRVGAVAAILFLELNDVELDAPEDRLVTLVLDVAQGQMEKRAISEFFRQHVT